MKYNFTAVNEGATEKTRKIYSMESEFSKLILNFDKRRKDKHVN